MTKITAVVSGNIEKNRVLNIHQSENRDELCVGTPSKRGDYADFVTGAALEDGQSITITLTNAPFWEVMTSTPVEKGAYVAADIDGTVGQFTDAPVYIGYTLDSGEAGQVVRVVKSPRVNMNPTEYIAPAPVDEAPAAPVIEPVPAPVVEEPEPAPVDEAPDAPVNEEQAEPATNYTREELEDLTVSELRDILKAKNISGYSSMVKAELIDAVIETQNGAGAL